MQHSRHYTKYKKNMNLFSFGYIFALQIQSFGGKLDDLS